MVCCTNNKIPESSSTEFIFKPISCRWINGLANTYGYTKYNKLLEYIDEKTLNYVFNRINDDLYTYWPCPTCFCYGYLFSICTLGISFLFTYVCIRDAMDILYTNIRLFNNKYFKNKNLELSFHKVCCTSYLKIKVLDINKSINNNNTSVKNNNNLEFNELKDNSNLIVYNQV